MRPGGTRSVARWLAATLAAWALGTPGALAQSPPALTITPASAPVGATVVVAGASLPAACTAVNEVVVTAGDAGELARFQADLLGGYSVEVVVPDLPAGVHQLTSRCHAAGALGIPVALGTADFEVSAAPAAPSPVPPAAPADPGEPIEATNPPPSTLPRVDDTPTTSIPVAEEAVPPIQDKAVATVPPPAPEAPIAPPAETGGVPATAEVTPMAVPDRWGPGQYISDLTDPTLTADGAGAAGFLLLIFSLLIGFPATMFHGTYRRHYDQINTALRARLGPVVRATDAIAGRLPRFPLTSMVVFGTFTAAAVDPSLAIDARSFGVVTGLAVVVGLGGWLGWWPTKRTSDAYGNEGEYRSYPMGLLIAIACVLLTRFANLHPGYLYGLLFAYETRGRWTKRDDGLTFLLGYLVVFVIGMAAWLALSVLQPAAVEDPSGWVVAFDTVLTGFAVVGIQGVVFGMIPFTFAPGRAIWSWSPRAWLALWIPGALALAVMLSTPSRELLAVQGEGVSVVRALVAFLAFAGVSVAFWSYWRRRETRSSVSVAFTADTTPLTPAALEDPELPPAPAHPHDEPRVLSPSA